jgi:hypothetical protein
LLIFFISCRKEVGAAPDKELFDKSSKGSKPFSGGKRFTKKNKSKSFGDGDQRLQKRDGDKKKKGKRKVKVFNSDGVGPNYKKGGGDDLRGVKAGRVQKRGDKAGRVQKKGRKPPR